MPNPKEMLLKAKDQVAKAAGARGGQGGPLKKLLLATSAEATTALARGMKAAGVKPSHVKFPFDKEGARKAATHNKPGKRPRSKK